jgi:hypothetical protein
VQEQTAASNLSTAVSERNSSFGQQAQIIRYLHRNCSRLICEKSQAIESTIDIGVDSSPTINKFRSQSIARRIDRNVELNIDCIEPLHSPSIVGRANGRARDPIHRQRQRTQKNVVNQFGVRRATNARSDLPVREKVIYLTIHLTILNPD